MADAASQSGFWSLGSAIPGAQPPAPAPSWTPGTRLGDYQLEARLGRGAHATVFRARNTRIDRLVALKALDRLDADEHARLEREARLLARLRHPAILRIYDVLVHQGVPVLVVELASGGTLEERWAALSCEEALGVLESVARGLGAAHGAGIVHRDVKPNNVLLTEDGPRLSDFGLALSLDARRLTQTGALIGTPSYMAPEQLQGKAVGPPADVWALGVILFRLLTGQLPFQGPNLLTQLQLALGGAPSFASLGVNAAPELEAVCGRALAADPSLRFPDASAFAEALALARAAQTAPPPARRPGWAIPLVLAAVGGAALATVPGQRAPAAPTTGPGEIPPAATSWSTPPALEAARAAVEGEHMLRGLALLEPTLAQDPGLWRGWYLRGLALQWLGDLAGAEASLTRALAHAPADVRALELRAQVRFERWEEAQAEEDVNALRRLAHEDPTAWAALARLYRAWGREGDAQRVCDEGIARGPQEASVYYERALLRLSQGDPAGAAADTALGHELPSAQDPEAWVHLAAAFVDRDEHRLALEVSTRCLALRPDSAKAWFLRGHCLEHLVLPGAREAYDRALARDASQLSALLARGRMRLAENDPVGALRDLERAWPRTRADARNTTRLLRSQARLALDPTDDEEREVLRLWREVLAAQARDGRAGGEQHLGNLLRLRPHDADAWTALGSIALARGDLDTANARFSRALELDPSQVSARGYRAELRLELGLTGEAAQDYQLLVNLEPSESAAWRGLGVALQNQHRFEAALRAAERAIGLRPRQEALDYAFRAMTHAALGDATAARRDVARAGSLPCLPGFQTLVAEATLVAGEPGAALRQLDARLAADEDDARARALRGECKRRLGLPGAAEDLARALELHPRNTTAHCFLGCLQLEQGKLAEAAASLERSLSDPTWHVQAQAREALERARRLLKED